MSEVKVYPPIILKPEDSFGKLLEKLYAEGWGVNSAEYMQADTLEEAVKLQAKSFPCLEFQPVQLSKPDNQYPYHHEGKWVAFHRTPKPKTPDSYGDWIVFYNSTEKYWFLRNEKTLKENPKHFDHPPTLEEIKDNVEPHLLPEKEKPYIFPPQAELPCETEECEKCPDPCNDEDRCGFGVRKSDACEDDACQECEERYLNGEDIVCHYFDPDVLVKGDQLQDEKGNIHTVVESSYQPLAHAKEGKYSIHIEPPKWQGYKYALNYSKNYGSYRGGATEFKTKQELLNYIKTLFLEWEEYDSILGREPDKVTPKTLDFQSFTPEITKMELFGLSRIDAFFGNQQNP